MEKVNVIVEQELPDGRTYPIVAMTMGKYKREGIEMKVQNWSSTVSLDSLRSCSCTTKLFFSISADG